MKRANLVGKDTFAEQKVLIKVYLKVVKAKEICQEVHLSNTTISGVYCCNHVNGEKYFIIQEYEGKLAPYYTTWEMNEEGINNFPCKSIEESISLTEC
ncbi:hypothetical protein I6R72_001801 [Enterococcus faecium]|nr:hypothetical protein [Enterococcus faecium]